MTPVCHVQNLCRIISIPTKAEKSKDDSNMRTATVCKNNLFCQRLVMFEG